MTLVGTLFLGMLAGLACAVAVASCVALLWPGVRRAARRLPPGRRAGLALAAAVAPALLAVAFVLLCFSPGALGLLGWHHDHCLEHAGHPHLCLVHPTALLTPGREVFALALGVAVASVAARGASRWLREERALRGLRAAARPRDGFFQLASGHAFSFTAGILRPVTYVSAGLVDALAPGQLGVVLAHERAHARNRDGARMRMARALAIAHFPPVRRRILADLELAMEQACDEAAAAASGSRLGVAETLLRVERLCEGAAMAPASRLGFGGSSVPARVRSLLAPPVAESAGRGAWILLAVGLLLAIASTDALHHGAEHLLGLLLG